MRLDIFLKTVGIVKRRAEAARLLRAGLVLIDGRVAKPASAVAPGQRIQVESARWIREFEVLELPATRSVAKSEATRYARLVSETEKERP